MWTVRNEDEAGAALEQLRHVAEALHSEFQIAYRQHFIDQQYIRLSMHGTREPQARRHTRAVSLHRGVKRIANFRERHHFLKPRIDLFSRQTEDRHVDV